jgi:hypothetical protein
MRDEGKQSDSIICDACGAAVPNYDVVSYGSIELGYRELCNCCFNTEVANVLGLERFAHVRLHPVVMSKRPVGATLRRGSVMPDVGAWAASRRRWSRTAR